MLTIAAASLLVGVAALVARGLYGLILGGES